MTLLQARKTAEMRIGFQISNEEYAKVLAYSRQKLSYIGKEEEYLPVLLENEIRDYCAGREINLKSAEMRRTRKCVVFA